MDKHADTVAAILDAFVEKRLAGADRTGAIPRILHQTYPTKTLPEPLASNVLALRTLNLDWEYRLYDDADIERFIAEEYGPAVLKRYLRISPSYGAARADLFRYLLIYRQGGLYLDIKSTADRPLNDVFGATDHFVVSQWDNAPGREHEIWGLHPDLAHVPGGEFQQWFIASAPGHPFLRAVIERVLGNIERYNPFRDGVGLEVVRVTGPVAYTFAIEPLLARYPHRRVASEATLGLRYSVMAYHAHHVHFRGHYSQRMTPIIGEPGGKVTQAVLTVYIRTRRQIGRVIKHAKRLYRRARGLPVILTQ
ncbi:glycosyltransferase family 32 protein [Sphingomonas aquatilis]